MKKWGFLVFLVVCLAFAFNYLTPNAIDGVEVQQYNPNEKDRLDDQGDTENVGQKDITIEQIYQGNLVLINNQYPIHEESIQSDVVNLSEHNELTEGYVLLSNEIYLSADIAHKFREMIADAGKDGLHDFAITSGFRSFEQQNILYEQMGAERALPPGYSEHNFGLALDVGSIQMKMEDAPEGKWIEENAWKYGFILRYPEDKTDITGIQYEPWHIRYVGLPHSAIMYEKNLVLEEYLNYLKEEQNISVNVKGETYTVSYHPVSQDVTIKVPMNHHYEVSGNNMDGVIVTVYE